MSIWIIVIFVILTIVGLVMVGIGFHEKTKHKDDPTGKPGKTYDILLYAGIALAVVGIIGLIWSMISYAKSKKESREIDMGPPMRYGPPPSSRNMQNSDEDEDEDEEFEVQQRRRTTSVPSNLPYNICVLPDGRLFDLTKSSVISQQPSAPTMNPFNMFSQSSSSSCNNNSLNLEEFMKAAKLLKELKDIINC